MTRSAHLFVSGFVKDPFRPMVPDRTLLDRIQAPIAAVCCDVRLLHKRNCIVDYSQPAWWLLREFRAAAYEVNQFSRSPVLVCCISAASLIREKVERTV